MNEKLFPFSYSKVSLYKECPQKFKFRYIDKITPAFKDTFVFEKGRWMHKILEHFPAMPEKLSPFKFAENIKVKNDIIESLKRFLKAGTGELLKNSVKDREIKFYIDKNFEICQKKDSFYTGVVDCILEIDGVIYIVDWKSGKTKMASFNQLKYYAIWARKYYKNENIVCRLAFIELEENVDLVIENIDLLETELTDSINTIIDDENFEKKPNNKCQYCEYFMECSPTKIKLRL